MARTLTYDRTNEQFAEPSWVKAVAKFMEVSNRATHP